jgi:CheY-like chemotaxis protein
MSKIEAGKLFLTEEKTRLSEDMQYVLSMMRSRAGDNDITISIRSEITHDVVLTDNLRLNQVLINLISNAIKFSNRGSEIKLTMIETETDGDRSLYRFSVSDQGIGMSEEQIDRLFKAFEQADSSITRRFGGTGLGLSISKNIVEMMGGEIWVESEVGKGSIFYFTARLKTPGESDEEVANVGSGKPQDCALPVPDFSGLRILVADDIEINRIIVQEMLLETGVQIEEAGNGREAVALFEDNPPEHFDIILMDMQMPEMDGLEATREIRASRKPDAKTVAIVAMTANAMKSDVELVLEAGMNGHIAKPIDFENVIDTIRRMCTPRKEEDRREEDRAEEDRIKEDR